MDKYNIYKQLKESLEGFRQVPSKESRTQFLMDAQEVFVKRKKSFWHTYGRFIIIGFIALSVVTYLLFEDEKNGRLYTNEDHSRNTGQLNNTVHNAKDETLLEDTIERYEEEPENKTIETVTDHQNENNNTISLSSGIDLETAIGSTTTFESNELFGSAQKRLKESHTHLYKPFLKLKATPLQIDNPLAESIQLHNVSKAMANTQEYYTQKDPNEEGLASLKNKQLNKRFSYALYYRPEIINNLIEVNKTAHNFGFRISRRLYNGRYSVGSGLGISVSKGYYEYATAYNEYIGTFNRLDSISFAWDEKQFNLIQTRHVSEARAFNDEISVDFANVYKRHIYLQIPINFGYDFYRKNKLSIGVVFGPRLSVLINTKNLNFLPDNGLNQIIQINQITPDRIKTNWQIFTGLQLSYKLKNGYFIGIEPEVNYYFNSVYEKADINTHPWSLGISIIFGIN